MEHKNLPQLKRYTVLVIRQWQQQKTATLTDLSVQQEVKLICNNLKNTHHPDLTLLANWLNRQIAQSPKQFLPQGTFFYRRGILQIFQDFESKLTQFIRLLSPSQPTLSPTPFSSPSASRPSSQKYNPLIASAIASPHLIPPSLTPFHQLPNTLQESIRRAGLRPGETCSWQEAIQKYEKMPAAIRRQGVDKIWEYKKQHDWSHRKAHCNGGSNSPYNGDWEIRKINRARGGQDMSPSEIAQVNKVKAKINFNHHAKIVVNQSLKAGGIALAVEGAFSGLENFIAVQRGEKSIEQGIKETLAQSIGAAVTTSVIAGGVVAVCITFPPVGVALNTASPVLQIVGVAACAKRLVNILTRQPNLAGIDQLQALMDSYGFYETELKFWDLEVEHELDQLKSVSG